MRLRLRGCPCTIFLRVYICSSVRLVSFQLPCLQDCYVYRSCISEHAPGWSLRDGPSGCTCCATTVQYLPVVIAHLSLWLRLARKEGMWLCNARTNCGWTEASCIKRGLSCGLSGKDTVKGGVVHFLPSIAHGIACRRAPSQDRLRQAARHHNSQGPSVHDTPVC